MANNRYKFLTEKDEYEIFNLVRNAFLSAHNGRDVEKSVLSKALQLVLNEQVVVYGNKTVVF